MKKLLLFLALAPGLAMAQTNQTADFNILYDLDTTNVTYCVVTGQGGNPWAPAIPGDGRIETSGSSTTITEVVSGQNPFGPIVATDILLINDGAGNQYVRVVDGKTDGGEITVSVALDLSSEATFSYKKTTCGTGVTAGWIGVSQFEYLTLPVQYNAGDLGSGLDIVWECKGNGPNAQPIQIYPESGDHNIATAGAKVGDAVVAANPWTACRIGIAASASDADGTVESITASVIGR